MNRCQEGHRRQPEIGIFNKNEYGGQRTQKLIEIGLKFVEVCAECKLVEGTRKTFTMKDYTASYGGGHIVFKVIIFRFHFNLV